MRVFFDPPLKPQGVRPVRKRVAAPSESASKSAESNLPVAVEPAVTVPNGPGGKGGETALHAQVIGERRGLRAGPTIHDEARGAYNSVEWSGAKDRRRPKGGAAKTKV